MAKLTEIPGIIDEARKFAELATQKRNVIVDYIWEKEGRYCKESKKLVEILEEYGEYMLKLGFAVQKME